MFMNTKAKTTVHRTGLGFGVLLILLGGVFLMANFGLIPNLKSVIISWQMLLIAIGILSFRKHPFSGFCLILVGSFFIIPRLADAFPTSLSWVNDDFISNYWAILLIAVGIFWIVVPHRKWHRRCRRHRNYFYHHYCGQDDKQYETNGEFSKTHIFSAGEYIVTEPEFKGGEVKVIFGTSEIDLRKTSLPEGDTYLKLEVIFGGVTLFISSDWRIEQQTECVFSGVADRRYIIEPAKPSRRLILVGECVFSGCEIKN